MSTTTVASNERPYHPWVESALLGALVPIYLNFIYVSALTIGLRPPPDGRFIGQLVKALFEWSFLRWEAYFILVFGIMAGCFYASLRLKYRTMVESVISPLSIWFFWSSLISLFIFGFVFYVFPLPIPFFDETRVLIAISIGSGLIGGLNGLTRGIIAWDNRWRDAIKKHYSEDVVEKIAPYQTR